MLTEQQVEDRIIRYRSFLTKRARKHKVRQPVFLSAALAHYLIAGRISTHGFLANILNNKLKETLLKADPINQHQLKEIVTWLRGAMPAVAWDIGEWSSKSMGERAELMDHFFRLEDEA